jgi:hypothetical protein
MFMILSVLKAKFPQTYWRPGGWRWTGHTWVQNDNAFCGCASTACCKC